MWQIDAGNLDKSLDINDCEIRTHPKTNPVARPKQNIRKTQAWCWTYERQPIWIPRIGDLHTNPNDGARSKWCAQGPGDNGIWPGMDTRGQLSAVIGNYWSRDNHQWFWIREDIPIRVHADDYERYESKQGWWAKNCLGWISSNAFREQPATMNLSWFSFTWNDSLVYLP